MSKSNSAIEESTDRGACTTQLSTRVVIHTNVRFACHALCFLFSLDSQRCGRHFLRWEKLRKRMISDESKDSTIMQKDPKSWRIRNRKKTPSGIDFVWNRVEERSKEEKRRAKEERCLFLVFDNSYLNTLIFLFPTTGPA